jgi:hypothetical protein
MILRDFISKSLLDIVGGLQDVQAKAPELILTSYAPGMTEASAVKIGATHYQSVDFEVMVRAEEASGDSAKLKVAVFGGVHGESSKSEGHSATLRFKIPINLSAIP